MHKGNGDNADNNNGDSVTSISDGGSGTPPIQQLLPSQPGSLDGDDAPITNTTNSTNSTKPTASIPLGENTLLVDISDALSEKDKVKFTVHTRTTFPSYSKKDFLVVRQHEEFIWLHDRYEENEEYAGYIVSTPSVVRLIYLQELTDEKYYYFRYRRAHHGQTLMHHVKSYSVLVKVKAT